MRSALSRHRAILLGCAAALLTFALAPIAQAAPTRTPAPVPSFEGAFNIPVGVATDPEGNVYVASDTLLSKVGVYSPAGSLITEFTTGANSGPKNLSVDSAGNVYVVAGGVQGAQKFKPSSFPPTGSTTYAPDGTLSASAASTAVNPVDQTVYVAQPPVNEKQTFARPGPVACSPATEFTLTFEAQTTGPLPCKSPGSEPPNATIEAALNSLSSIGGVGGSVAIEGGATKTVEFKGAFTGINISDNAITVNKSGGAELSKSSVGTPNGAPSKISVYQANGTPISSTTGTGVPGASYTGVDVYGANGNIYAADPAHNKAYIFKAGESTPAKQITGSEAPSGAFTGMEKPTVAVDQSNGNVLVSDIKGHGVVDEFNSAGKYVTQITHAPPFVESGPSDIAVDANGKVYITSGAGLGGNVFVYGAIHPKFALTLAATGTGSISCDVGLGAEACLGEYVEGEKVTLTASPGVGWTFKEWTGACTGSGTCEVTMSAAKAVTAVFWKPHTLTVTPAGAGSGSISADSGPISTCSTGGGTCSGLYGEGTKVTLTATPAAHNKVTWSGCAATPTVNTCEVTIATTNAGVTATFTEAPQRSINLTVAGSGASVSASSGTIVSCTSAGGANCSSTYFEGDTVTLTATPAAHKKVAWSGGCTATPSPNVCEVTLGGSNAAIAATVTAIKRTLTISTGGSGAVKCNGVACLPEYDEGTSITLTAVPATHWSFGGWSAATGSAICTGTGACTFTLEANSSVTASFSAIKRSLTVNREGSGTGSVSCNGGACAASYDEGTTVTLSAAAGSDSTFSGWSGACTGSGTCVVTINADTVVTAKFDKTSAPLSCVVPKLAGMKLSKAKSALTAAHCTAGKVTKPKPKKGKKQGALVVKSSKPSAGTTLAADAKVDLKLGPKPKPKKKHKG